MDINNIPIGKNPPEDINVIIEIPANSPGIKYEFDKDSGSIFVDRFMATPMHYPTNYGFVPNTLSDDGDPADVLVVTPYKLEIGSVINTRPIGVLLMEDESGKDEKIIAVPGKKLTSLYDNIDSYKDLPKLLLDQIKHFFENYKDLEPEKWVKVSGWQDADYAKKILKTAIQNA
ncbi:MAG: inorganic diphosphatase [Pseudomonadota bacterium]